MRPVEIVNSVIDRIIDVMAYIAVLLLAFIMLAVCADVVMRYFFSRPMIWVTEVTEYSLLWITFLGTSWVLKRKAHVIMDLAIGKLEPRARNIIAIFTSLVGMAVCLLVTWYGVKVTVDAIDRNLLMSTILSPPAYILYIIIPIGSFLLAIQFLRMILGFINAVKNSGDIEITSLASKSNS